MLKMYNPFYKYIILPNTIDELHLEELNNPEFVIQDTENDIESVLHDNYELRPKIEIQKITK